MQRQQSNLVTPPLKCNLEQTHFELHFSCVNLLNIKRLKRVINVKVRVNEIVRNFWIFNQI